MFRILLLLFFTACGQAVDPLEPEIVPVVWNDTLTQPEEKLPPVVDWAAFAIQLSPDSVNYTDQCAGIASIREILESAWRNGTITIDSVGKTFTELLVNRIIPYWYGTPWAYEGHTNVPGEGEIACGYLVSTSLKHMGLNLNRYRLAQQAALVEARTLAMGQPIVSMIRMDLKDVIGRLRSDFQDGLYIVGLDYHVGLLLMRRGEPFFIHSSLYDPMTVVIEPAETSEALLYNDDYYFAPISNNPGLMQAWLEGTPIRILE